MSSTTRWPRLVAPALIAVLMTGACAAAATIAQSTTGAGDGGFFGPDPTTGWLTAVGLVSVGVVGVVRRRHRAVT